MKPILDNRPSTAKAIVLLADPDANSNLAVAAALLERGYDILHASSLSTALPIAPKFSIAYALTDIAFSDGSAIGLIRALTDRNPECRTVVHSNRCSIAGAVACVSAGAADVLPKPADTDFLLSILLGDELRTPDFAPFPHPEGVRNEHIRYVLESCGGNVSSAARRLNMHRRTLQRIKKRLPEVKRQA